MKVLLSIKPPFVQKIMTGEKQWEYRRVIFRQPVDSVVIYESAPHQRIVGEFHVESVITDTVDALWRRTGAESGISYEDFRQYFHGCERGYAIRIGHLTRYARPLNPWDNDAIFHPPQSFRYVAEGLL
jgi:predicted transcriptional regulator